MNKKTVMAIDDQEMVLQVVASMLARSGYNVMEFSDAEKALEVLRAGVRVDVVILDVLMPKLDGVTTFQKIKEIVPGLPVILSSGMPAVEVGKQFPVSGQPKWFLQKPYGMLDLLAVVQKVFGEGVWNVNV